MHIHLCHRKCHGVNDDEPEWHTYCGCRRHFSVLSDGAFCAPEGSQPHVEIQMQVGAGEQEECSSGEAGTCRLTPPACSASVGPAAVGMPLAACA